MSALQIYKILLQYILLYFCATAFPATAEISAIRVFHDFLNLNHLHHGIVVQVAENHKKHHFELKDLRNLFENHRIRFCNVGSKAKDDFLTSYLYASSPRVGIFVPDWESVQQKVLTAASVGDFFNNSQAWFVLTADSANFYANIESTFRELKINIDADITLGLKTTDSSNSSIMLYDIYKIHAARGNPLEIEPKGIWSIENGFRLLPKFDESFVRRRRNFQNYTLMAGTAIIEKPANLEDLVYLMNVEDNKQLDAMQRKTYNLLKMMEPMLNLSFKVVFSSTWGQLVEGNWTGVMANLLDEKVELAICPMRFTLERVHAIQYTPELHTEIVRFLLRHPRRNVIRNIFFEPLTDEVWWSVLALTVLTVLLLAFHMQHEQKRRRVLSATAPVERRMDAICLHILEAIFMQGPSPSIFRAASTRILILTICAFSVMLLQFYGAFIVGSLLAIVPRSITNLPALYNSSLDIGMEHVAYNYDIFVNTSNKIANDFYTQRIARNHLPPLPSDGGGAGNILTLERGAERIGRGGFAFHVAVDRAYRILKYLLTESEFCDLQEIALYPPFTTSAALRKNSPYREYFAHIILHFRATSLIQYNDKLWAVQKTDCSLKQNAEVEVDMEHFIPALVLLAMAMLISVFVLAVELAINSWYGRQSQRRN